MDKEKLNQINELREELRKIDEKMIELSNKGNFLLFFIKSILTAIVFVLVSNLFNLPNQAKIIVFVLIFIMANFFQALIIKHTRKDELENLKKEQIKIQVEIFKLSKDLK
ncbi:hypothetical protein [Anaerococcus porci]|uniref:Uncharacterized protein n=2 Tax=Anaerococcus TaxID=165779 RepID=A0A6N7VUU1_9FIRM|nr:hypothetical protein [Anaerococcus porci]MDY3006879.1 hypothetical protein [Anaerococcus porci]MSS77794.1 hypothetical protein [Anaerococcus porci]